jgi:glucarate dehydratase
MMLASGSGPPVVTAMTVVPVAGHDSMLLNLSGAHGPFFTRNVVILEDNAGRARWWSAVRSGPATTSYET